MTGTDVVIEGRLHISLQWDGQAVRGVRIDNHRPLGATGVLEGRLPDEAMRLLPRLYGVCGMAQTAAAEQACAAAAGRRLPAPLGVAREIQVCLETAREHAWRILLDWPGFAGKAAVPRAARALGGLLPEAGKAMFRDGAGVGLNPEVDFDLTSLTSMLARLEAILAEVIFGASPSIWYRQNPVSFERWIDNGSTPAARLLREVRAAGWGGAGAAEIAPLPQLDEDVLHRRLGATDAEHFIARPAWGGKPAETTPYARERNQPLVRSLEERYGNGLLPRLTARLVELAAAPERLRVALKALHRPGVFHPWNQAGRDATGCDAVAEVSAGLGQVEAARGRLVHRVELAAGRLGSYRILAPTEWNFHPGGVVAQGLKALQAKEESSLQRQAALLINAVDPCVAYDLEVCRQ